MYQPNPFDDYSDYNTRVCRERFSFIDKSLPNKPLSCLDIGCNEGYFVFKLAKRGGFCVGIDSGRNEIMVANSIKAINNVDNAVFSNLHLKADDVKNYPVFEVILFLSVFHHLVKNNGLDYAKLFVKNIFLINSKYFIFETGQPNEEGVPWASKLNFMLPDIDNWIKNMLIESGYKKITLIGKNKSIRSTTQRSLFLAEK
jgi:SAM-dependent methyltransferase